MKQENLLEGNIKRQLIVLAVPLLIGNIMQQLYNTADSLLVGKALGVEAFSAVGAAGSVMNLLIFLLNGFCIGVSTVFSQLFGSGSEERIRKESYTSIVFGGLLAIFLSAAAYLSCGPVLRLIHTPESLMADAECYLKVIILGLPITYFYNLFLCMLSAIGETSRNLQFLTVSVVLNIAADYFILCVLHTGVGGAAAATVLSQLAAGGAALHFLLRRHRGMLFRKEDVGIHRELIARTFRNGFSAALHQSSLYIGKLLVQGSVNTLGVEGIAAYTASNRIEGVVNAFGSSGSQSMSIFFSQNYGAGKKERIRQGMRDGEIMLILLSLALSVLMFLFAAPGIRIFLDGDHAQAVSYGVDYLRYISVFYVFNYIGNGFVGYFRGTNRVMLPVYGTTFHISIRVILSALLIRRMGLGAVGLASGIGWIFVTLFDLAALFLGNKHAQTELQYQ